MDKIIDIFQFTNFRKYLDEDPVIALMIPRISKLENVTYKAAWIVCGGIMISITTQANQNFFSGNSNRANP